MWREPTAEVVGIHYTSRTSVVIKEKLKHDFEPSHATNTKL